jgi:hypothetical protein
MADEAERVSQQKNEASGPASHFIASRYGFMQIIDYSPPTLELSEEDIKTAINYQAAVNYIKSRYGFGTSIHEQIERWAIMSTGGFADDPAIDEAPEDNVPLTITPYASFVPEEQTPWADPDHDVVGDLREALGGVASRTVTEDDD